MNEILAPPAPPKPLAPRARGGVLSVHTVTVHTAHVRGSGVVAALNQAGIPHQWSPEARCWSMPAHRVPDLVADCQRHGRRLVVQDVLR